MLKRSKEFIQAYQEAPWRRQMQIIGMVAGGVVALALVAGIYLNITARSATTGRLVQQMQSQRSDTEQGIEDLQTQLAFLRSIEQMQKRARALGFAPVQPASIMYLSVPEYQGMPTGAELAPRAGSNFGAVELLPAAYTDSLFDWVAQILSQLGGY